MESKSENVKKLTYEEVRDRITSGFKEDMVYNLERVFTYFVSKKDIKKAIIHNLAEMRTENEMLEAVLNNIMLKQRFIAMLNVKTEEKKSVKVKAKDSKVTDKTEKKTNKPEATKTKTVEGQERT